MKMEKLLTVQWTMTEFCNITFDLRLFWFCSFGEKLIKIKVILLLLLLLVVVIVVVVLFDNSIHRAANQIILTSADILFFRMIQ